MDGMGRGRPGTRDGHCCDSTSPSALPCQRCAEALCVEAQADVEHCAHKYSEHTGSTNSRCMNRHSPADSTHRSAKRRLPMCATWRQLALEQNITWQFEKVRCQSKRRQQLRARHVLQEAMSRTGLHPVSIVTDRAGGQERVGRGGQFKQVNV